MRPSTRFAAAYAIDWLIGGCPVAVRTEGENRRLTEALAAVLEELPHNERFLG